MSAAVENSIPTPLKRKGNPQIPTALAALILLATQLLPPLPMYLGVTHSMALGVSIAAGLSIITVFGCHALGLKRLRLGWADTSAGALVFILTASVLIVIHGGIADEIMGVHLGRFVASLVLLALLLSAAAAFASALRAASNSQVHRIVSISFWVLCAVAITRLVHLEPRRDVFSKPMFPFTETSFFALAFCPIYLFKCATTPRQKRTFWVLFGFTLAIVLKSATLLAIACVGAFVCRRILLILLVSLLVLGAGASHYIRYFTSRADISSSNKNLSALVYLEGWEMLGRSLSLSHGWGLGFQQQGYHATDVTAAAEIRGQTGGFNLNLQNGSFVLSKLGSEFGVFGLLLIAAYTFVAIRSLRVIRHRPCSESELLSRCIFVGYGIDIFIRGTGYFSASTLLFLAATFTLYPPGALLRKSVTRISYTAMVFR